jgi:tetratricopeptide (TPR) repeat protein
MVSTRGNWGQACVLAGLITLGLTGCGGAAARYQSHLQRGKQYLAAGNLDKAGVEFRNAVQIQPKAPEALYLEGRVAEQRGDVRAAAGLYRAAIDQAPGYSAAQASLGRLLVFSGAVQRALETVSPGLTAHPDDPDLLAVHAAALHQQKRDIEAQADAEHAVRVAPTNENAISVLAALYAAEQAYPKAISLVDGAARKSPNAPDLHEVLANLYLTTGQADKAEEEMRKVVELRPHEMAPRMALALHFVRANKLDAAEQVLEEAVQSFGNLKDPARADEAKLALVEFIATRRSREQGEKKLRGFIAQDPANMDLRLGLGALLQRTGAPKEAEAVYRGVIDHEGSNPKGLMARDRVAAIEVSQGRQGEARKLVEEVLQKNPRDDDALILRANMELRGNDPTSAVGDLRAVLRDAPNSVPLQGTLARAYLAKGEPALAEETLRNAMRSAPQDVDLRIELAQLLAQSNRGQEAATLLQETARSVPDNPQVREALIRTYLLKQDLPAARAVAEEMKARQPNSPTGFYFAGLVAEQQKHLEESRRDLQHAHELQPRAIEILASLARVELVQGAGGEAIAAVQLAIKDNPGSAELLNLLGSVYLEQKDLPHARESFARASALDPGSWEAHRKLALVALAQNDPNGAISEYERASRIAPAEPRLIAELAQLYERQGRPDEAISRYESLYKSYPNLQQVAANNLAMLLVTYRTDRASLDRARDLTSGFTSTTNGSLLDTLGWVRFKRGEYADAVAFLERAIADAPGSRVIRYHLAMAQLQIGQRDRARENLEAALAGSESFSGAEEARVALATLKASSG